MTWALRRTSDATSEPVTRDEAKLHMRVTHTDEDTLIDGLVTAARRWVEEYTQSALVTQTWQLTLDAFPHHHHAGAPLLSTRHIVAHQHGAASITIPRPPLQTVNSITFTRQDGTTGTVDSTSYIVDTQHTPGRVVLKTGESWPSDTLQSAAAVTVDFDAGYGGAAAVPQELKQAILLLAGHLYEHREAVVVGGGGNDVELPMATRTLASPYRLAFLGAG